MFVIIKNAGTQHNLRAYPPEKGSKVDLTTNQDAWEIWKLQHLQENKVSLRSTFGTFLRAHPNQKVDLANQRKAWQNWIMDKKEGKFYFQSQHGTFLSCKKDEAFCSGTMTKNQLWQIINKVTGQLIT